MASGKVKLKLASSIGWMTQILTIQMSPEMPTQSIQFIRGFWVPMSTNRTAQCP